MRNSRCTRNQKVINLFITKIENANEENEIMRISKLIDEEQKQTTIESKFTKIYQLNLKQRFRES